MRLFIAADLTEQAKQAIAAEQKRLVSRATLDSLKLVKPDVMHLTLLFLGDVQETHALKLVDAMNMPVEIVAFDLAFGGIGVFPPRGAPQVLWLGVTQGATPLMDLQAEIASRVRRLGIVFDDRPFHAHLTLGRWRDSRHDRSVRRAAKTFVREVSRDTARSKTVATVRVARATLYHSRLSSAGSTYTALAHANLSPSNQ
jgi:RNA 2',3'-cyclic 3'-phosphodiesterase